MPIPRWTVARSLSSVNTRSRCGLDPMLAGNILSALNVDIRRGEPARSIAERIRHDVDHFADEHCDMRINQEVLDAAGIWRGARCVSHASFNPDRWNPLITNVSGFGVHRIAFEDTRTELLHGRHEGTRCGIRLPDRGT